MPRRSTPEQLRVAKLAGARRRLDDLKALGASDADLAEQEARIAELEGRTPDG